MKRVADDSSQQMQRVRVGVIGLIAVVLLIGLASVLFSGVREVRGRQAAGGGDAQVVANMAATDPPGNESDEPLADMGVAPGSASMEAPRDDRAR